MAKDPAFLFYPGDYLRDTQCLSEAVQVSYDRIMCEHMRNISEDMINIHVSKDKVIFFTKRLTDDEKAELFHVLKEVPGGYQIEWVAESLSKRKSYSESRSKNRKNKNKSHENISEHMEIEIVFIISNLKLENNINNSEKKILAMVVKRMMDIWLSYKPHYEILIEEDYHSLLEIAYTVAEKKGWDKKDILSLKEDEILKSWEKIVEWLNGEKQSEYYKTMPIDKVGTKKGFRDIMERMKTTPILSALKMKELENKRITQEQYFEQ